MATDQQPAFTAFTVTKRGDDQKDWWTPIGAAFPHKDGNGFNVVLQSIPLDGKIVLRPPKEELDEPPRETRREPQGDRRGHDAVQQRSRPSRQNSR